MSKNTGRSYHAKQTNKMVKALNSMSLETVLDWLHRASWALQDSKPNPPLGEPLSLKQYLIETKEVIRAEERMKRIEEGIEKLSTEERDRRTVLLEKEKEGVGQLI